MECSRFQLSKGVGSDKTYKIELDAIYQGIPEDLLLVLLSLADKTTTKEAWGALKTMCRSCKENKSTNFEGRV